MKEYARPTRHIKPGLRFPPSALCHDAATPANFSTGARQLPEFLLNWPDLDALICLSDPLACGVLYECQRRRINVPDVLAVVEFGHSDVSQVYQPMLTTMSVPLRQTGVEPAARCWRVSEEETGTLKPIIPKLCLRDSC